MEPGHRLFLIVSFHLFIYQDLHVLEGLREYWSVGSNRSDGKVLTCGLDVKKGDHPTPFPIERVWGPEKCISEHFE